MKPTTISIMVLAIGLAVALALWQLFGNQAPAPDRDVARSSHPIEAEEVRPIGDVELSTLEPRQLDRTVDRTVDLPDQRSDAEPNLGAVAVPEDEPEDPRNESWRSKYKGMNADQLAAESDRIANLYTVEMSRVTWPRFQSGDCSYADPKKGERPPSSKLGALVAVASQRDGRVPYVVITEDEAPVLHEWMSELAWLLAERERRRANEAGK